MNIVTKDYWFPEPRREAFKCEHFSDDFRLCERYATWSYSERRRVSEVAHLCDEHLNELKEKERCGSTASAEK